MRLRHQIGIEIAIILLLGAAARAEDLKTAPLGSVPAGLKVEGSVVDGMRWNDKSGNNLLILTETGPRPSPSSKTTIRETDMNFQDSSLFAYHYAGQTGKWSLVSRTFDIVSKCPMDITASFKKGSLIVTDLDRDGTGEFSFLYALGCRSDVSPNSLKLILREGQQKFALRGTTMVALGEGTFDGGDYTADPSFSGAPAAFKEFALKRWKEFVKE